MGVGRGKMRGRLREGKVKEERKVLRRRGVVCLFVGFLMSSSSTRLYCGRAPRQSVWQFYVLPHMRQRGVERGRNV